MSVIATALKHLIAAGVSGDDLVRAVAEMEAAADTRSTGAKRQARYRERNKSSQSVTPVTSDACGAPPNDIYSNPPEPLISDEISPPLPDFADRVVEIWNESTNGTPLPRARKLTVDRRKHLKARVREHGEEAVFSAIRSMAASDFHSGRSGKWTEGNLGWLLKSPENFLKMLERDDGTEPPRKAWTAEERAESLRRAAELDRKMGRTPDPPPPRRETTSFGKPIGQLIPQFQGSA